MNHNPLRGRPHLPSISTELAISILVVCFYVVFSLITPTFSSEYNLINLLKQASVKGIVTIAVTFVFIAGQCDLTVGASTALSAMICALLMSDHGLLGPPLPFPFSAHCLLASSMDLLYMN